MTQVYRILRAPYAGSPLDRECAYRFGGRWSSRGTRLAYTSRHLSLAMVEYFVHIDPDDPPKDLVVVGVDVPDSVSRISTAGTQLPVDWRQIPAPASLAAIGDAFAASRKAAILIVPSVLVPSETHWLVNPRAPRIRRHPRGAARALPLRRTVLQVTGHIRGVMSTHEVSRVRALRPVDGASGEALTVRNAIGAVRNAH